MNINLNNCILPVHRYLIILVKDTTATFHEQVITLGSFFFLMGCRYYLRSPSQEYSIPKTHCEVQKENGQKSSVFQQAQPNKLVPNRLSHLGNFLQVRLYSYFMFCIHILYCSTFYKRIAKNFMRACHHKAPLQEVRMSRKDRDCCSGLLVWQKPGWDLHTVKSKGMASLEANQQRKLLTIKIGFLLIQAIAKKDFSLKG